MHPKTLCTCRHLHGFHTSPQQTDHRILLGRQQTRSSESSSPIRSCRASLNAARQGAGQAVLMFSAAIWLTLQGPAAHAEDATVASFNKNCIGCHIGGGNVVQAGKTLFTGDLERNGLGAGRVDAIYDLIYGGKGKMPGYGSGCTPRGKCTFGPRLSDEEIMRLSAYVLDQAAKGWK